MGWWPNLDTDWINNLVNMRVAFIALVVSVSIGYSVFASVLVARSRILNKTLSTSYSGLINGMAVAHFAGVLFVSIVGILIALF